MTYTLLRSRKGTIMTSYTFQTASPVKLTVEFAKGYLDVVASDVDTTQIDIDTGDTDRLEVEQSGDQVRIVEPKRRGLSYLVNEYPTTSG